MAEFKLVINDVKKGKSYSKNLNDDESSNFVNLKIGDKVNGDSIALNGYEFEIRGGTDKSGFAMREDLDSTGRKKALLTKGPGIVIKRKGMRKRKTIRGNTISESISQINLKVLSYGKEDLDKTLGKEEAPKEEKKVEEKPKEEKKEEPKEEKEETKEQPKEEVKEEPKKEIPKEEKVEEKKVEEKPAEQKEVKEEKIEESKKE